MWVGPAPAREECVLLGFILGTAHGATVRGREGYHRVVFSSQQERCHPAMGPAFATTVVTRAAAPFHFPPAVTAGSDSCKVPGARRWGVRSLGDTVAGCPLQARAWGQLLCPERPSLSPPPLTSLRLVVHRM